MAKRGAPTAEDRNGKSGHPVSQSGMSTKNERSREFVKRVKGRGSATTFAPSDAKINAAQAALSRFYPSIGGGFIADNEPIMANTVSSVDNFLLNSSGFASGTSQLSIAVGKYSLGGTIYSASFAAGAPATVGARNDLNHAFFIANATLLSCVSIEIIVTNVTPEVGRNGSVRTGSAFIQVTPAPTCPIVGNAFYTFNGSQNVRTFINAEYTQSSDSLSQGGDAIRMIWTPQRDEDEDWFSPSQGWAMAGSSYDGQGTGIFFFLTAAVGAFPADQNFEIRIIRNYNYIPIRTMEGPLNSQPMVGDQSTFNNAIADIGAKNFGPDSNVTNPDAANKSFGTVLKDVAVAAFDLFDGELMRNPGQVIKDAEKAISGIASTIGGVFTRLTEGGIFSLFGMQAERGLTFAMSIDSTLLMEIYEMEEKKELPAGITRMFKDLAALQLRPVLVAKDGRHVPRISGMSWNDGRSRVMGASAHNIPDGHSIKYC